MAKVKVELKRSLIGKHKNNKKIIRALGLKKIGDVNVLEKNRAIQGMIDRVSYLISVEEQK